jgi:hypothetical protein
MILTLCIKDGADASKLTAVRTIAIGIFLNVDVILGHADVIDIHELAGRTVNIIAVKDNFKRSFKRVIGIEHKAIDSAIHGAVVVRIAVATPCLTCNTEIEFACSSIRTFAIINVFNATKQQRIQTARFAVEFSRRRVVAFVISTNSMG